MSNSMTANPFINSEFAAQHLFAGVTSGRSALSELQGVGERSQVETHSRAVSDAEPAPCGLAKVAAAPQNRQLPKTERQPTDAELDATVRELVEVERVLGWTRVLKTGEIVLERFFNGSCAEWSSKRRTKAQSIRRLAQREGCPFKKTALTQAVGVYVFHRSHPEVSQGVVVTPSHVATVLGIEERFQLELLRQAEQEGWSVRKLRERANLYRVESAGVGRAQLPGARRAISRVTSAVATLEEAHELLSIRPDQSLEYSSELMTHLSACENVIESLKIQCQRRAGLLTASERG